MKSIFTLFLITCAMALFAQKEANTWFFGDNAGIDFNGTMPQPLAVGQSSTWDNTSCISDSAGNLLFYTDGETVWNKNHFIMNNGDGLNGSNMGGQCALIVPQPSSSLYYIFTVDIFAGAKGFNYHIVDMSQQAGLGSVISKNNLLFTPSTEKIDAVYNPAGNIYWVMTHTWGTAHFYCYKLSSTGLNISPVVSNIGSVYSGGNPSGYNSIGQMTFSKDGSKLVSTVYSDGLVEIFDFDMTTGLLSKPRLITGYDKVIGAGFSENGSKVYISIWFTDNVYQFDLSVDSLPVILSSATIIGHATSTSSTGYKAGYIQLAPDQKLYIARYGMPHIAMINNPDIAGQNCGFLNDGLYLGGRNCNAGLCRAPVRSIATGRLHEQNSLTGLSVYPNPASNQCNFNFGGIPAGEIITLRFINAIGRHCLEVDIVNGSSHAVGIESLAPGCYTVKCECNGKSAGTLKLSVQR